MSGGGVTPLIAAEALAARVDALAATIARDPPDTAVIILMGAFVFASDLLRALSRRGVAPLCDHLRYVSYGKGTESSGTVHLLLDLENDPKGRDVLLIDDVYDSGRTLGAAVAHLHAREAARVRVCVLLDKPETARAAHVTPDFVGFSIPNHFVVGYGMDHAGRYRELPYVGVLAR